MGELYLREESRSVLIEAFRQGLLNSSRINFRALPSGGVIVVNVATVNRIVNDPVIMDFLGQNGQTILSVDELLLLAESGSLNDQSAGIFWGFPIDSVRIYQEHDAAINAGLPSPYAANLTQIYLDTRDFKAKVYTPTVDDYDGKLIGGRINPSSIMLAPYYLRLWNFVRASAEVTPDVLELAARSETAMHKFITLMGDPKHDAIAVFNELQQ